MKKILGLVLLLAAMVCHGQVTGSFTLSTNAVPASTTVTNTGTAATTDYVDCLHFSRIGLFTSAAGLGPSTGVYTLTFYISNDATNWTAHPMHTMALSLAGSNVTARAWTNFDCTGFRYFMPGTMGNAATNVATNTVVQWYFGHPGGG